MKLTGFVQKQCLFCVPFSDLVKGQILADGFGSSRFQSATGERTKNDQKHFEQLLSLNL